MLVEQFKYSNIYLDYSLAGPLGNLGRVLLLLLILLTCSTCNISSHMSSSELWHNRALEESVEPLRCPFYFCASLLVLVTPLWVYSFPSKHITE